MMSQATRSLRSLRSVEMTHYCHPERRRWILKMLRNSEQLFSLQLFGDSFFEASCRLGGKSTGRCL